jgi:tetratricopeptide (TPR) repeat protein
VTDAALFDRAKTLTQIGRYADAAALFRRVVATDPDDGRAWCELAFCEDELRRPSLSLAAADRAAALLPDQEWPHRLRSRALDALGRVTEATAAARRAVELAPDSLPSQTQLAWAASRAGLVDEAVAAGAAAVETAPDDGHAWFALARAHVASQNWGAAEEAFRKAVEIEPEDPWWHNNVAWVLIHQGRFEEARPWAERALAINPAHAAAKWNLRQILSSLGVQDRAKRMHTEGLQEALRNADASVAAEPRSSEAHLVRARALRRLGRLDAALAAARTAADIAPDDARPLLLVARYLAESGRCEEAQLALAEAHRLEPHGADTTTTRAHVAAIVGVPTGLTEEITDRLAEHPHDSDAWEGAGYNAAADHDWVRAYELFSRAHELGPTNCCAIAWKGIALAHEGDHGAAAECLEEATHVNPACFELESLASLLNDGDDLGEPTTAHDSR